MALLSPVLSPPDGFVGSAWVLATHGRSLPQPDQLCGPFAAAMALSAVLETPPSTLDLARVSGTRVWPHDLAGWRPAGAPLVRTGWDVLPEAAHPEASGTTGEGLAVGVESATRGAIRVVPVTGTDIDPGRCARLLSRLRDAKRAIGVIAHVRTGALDPESRWDVGHFVVLWAWQPDPARGGVVGVADSYRELGVPGSPPGCREVAVADLTAGLAADPGRGLLLLVPAADEAAVRALVVGCGLSTQIWGT